MTPPSLPAEIRLQAEQALSGFLKTMAGQVPLRADLSGTSIQIHNSLTHPLTQEQVHFPIALLEWQAGNWRLYFKGIKHYWIAAPSLDVSDNLQELLQVVVEDTHQKFWRC